MQALINHYNLWKHHVEDTTKKQIPTPGNRSALMISLLALSVKNLVKVENGQAWVGLMAVKGLGVYTGFMIREYGRHIRHGWKVCCVFFKTLKFKQ